MVGASQIGFIIGHTLMVAYTFNQSSFLNRSAIETTEQFTYLTDNPVLCKFQTPQQCENR